MEVNFVLIEDKKKNDMRKLVTRIDLIRILH